MSANLWQMSVLGMSCKNDDLWQFLYGGFVIRGFLHDARFFQGSLGFSQVNLTGKTRARCGNPELKPPLSGSLHCHPCLADGKLG